MKRLLNRLRCVLVAAVAPVSLFATTASADVKLPAIIANHMVLQQQEPVAIWGWADKGEEVTVAFAGQTQKATAGDNGKWMVKLQPLTASDKPAELTVSGKNKIQLKDILVGEVWVCSGQSNMEFRVIQAKDAQKDIAASANPNIRLFNVPKNIQEKPVSDIKEVDPSTRDRSKDPVQGAWGAASPESTPNFSAVGYFFGRDLQKELKVPVGLIHTSWGGTRAEAWTPTEWLKKDIDLGKTIDENQKNIQAYPDRVKAWEKQVEKWKADQAAAKTADKPFKTPQPRKPAAPGSDPNAPSVLYNGMIAPIVPFAIKGSIWYQGESNAGKAYQYRTLLPMMIDSWREAWGDKTDKFLIVQLANFQDPAKTPGDDSWAELREAQTMTANLPNNGQALAIDLADADNPKDIHPKNKQDVGHRLALVALGKYYGKSNVVYAGPTYESHKIEGNKVRITLKNADGLKTKDGSEKVTGFQICGEDKKWVWADAKIDGNGVVVWSDQVQKPVAVRYAWSSNPVTNLYNAAGLPAHPFRTDDWPGVTAPKKI